MTIVIGFSIICIVIWLVSIGDQRTDDEKQLARMANALALHGLFMTIVVLLVGAWLLVMVLA